MAIEIEKLTIQKIHEGLKNKEFTSVELTKEYLKQISSKDKLIGAFLTVIEASALEQAEKADQRISKEKDFPMLCGVPCAIKDNMLVDGVKCTSASKILENYVAPYDGTVIKKLKEQGAVILGKTNMDEFAMGSSTENSAFGPTKNPLDLERVPGGTSGGSAAAVAANMAAFSLGSDTGGSIRQPASFCGVVGYKPTYGAVSRYGLMAYSSSLDQIGPFTKNIEDCKIVLDAISGKDSLDATSLNLPGGKDSKTELKNLRIGIPKEYFIEGMDKDVEKVVRQAIKKVEDQGAKIVEISLPHSEYALATYYITASSEASANLAKFDGIRFGLSKDQNELISVYLKTRGEGFGPEVKRRIMLGTYSLSSGYYDAYYLKAQQVRDLIRQDFEKAFEVVDAIFSPVSPTVAFKIGEKVQDPLSMYLSDIYTISVNLAGLPAISMPCGKSQGLPVGLQIIGKQFDDYEVLHIASLVEKLV